MNNLVNVNNDLTMTSREIAELTGKRHDHVMNDIKKMLTVLDANAPEFSGTYRTSQGNEYPCFNLPKRETLILVSGYSVVMRAAIIDRWQELETNAPRQLSVPEASEEFIAFKNLALAFGLEGNPALISANNATINRTGYNFQKILGIELESFEQRTYLTPTQIGKSVEPSISAQVVNKLLSTFGYQDNKSGVWIPTEKGSEGLSQRLDTGKKRSDGTMVQQVKWCSSLIDVINSYLLDD